MIMPCSPPPPLFRPPESLRFSVRPVGAEARPCKPQHAHQPQDPEYRQHPEERYEQQQVEPVPAHELPRTSGFAVLEPHVDGKDGPDRPVYGSPCSLVGFGNLDQGLQSYQIRVKRHKADYEDSEPCDGCEIHYCGPVFRAGCQSASCMLFMPAMSTCPYHEFATVPFIRF